jgi:dihydrofolate synthase/folylpolyglutamate synthase
LPEIAAEKAGIIKAEVPVIISEAIPESKNVFVEKAKLMGAPIYFAEDFLILKSFQNNWETSLFEFEQPLIHLLDAPVFQKNFTIECDLPGKYQYKNLKGVLVAVQLLAGMGWKIKVPKVLSALTNIKKNTGLMGRWECIQDNPRIVLDVAHNEHGIHALLEQLQTLHYNKLHIVTGMVKDKDIDAVLKLLPTDALYYYTQSHIPRALPAKELAEKGKVLNLNGAYFENVNSALAAAKKNANQQDLILVIGSVFLVSEVNRSNFLPTLQLP